MEYKHRKHFFTLIQNIINLNFNKGDLMMLVCVICWALYSTLLKKYKFKFSQFSLIQLMVSVGVLFLIPQFFYEKSIGLEVNFNKAFFLPNLFDKVVVENRKLKLKT